MTVDLDVLSDNALDAKLQELFDQYHAAKQAGDINHARTLHLRIVDILAVQHRRLDAWIAQHST